MKKLIFSVLLLLMVAIGAVAQDDVTIGELSSTSSTYLPAYSLYNYSLTQQIYTSDEIGMAGTINSLSLWLKNNSNYARNLNVYMKEVDKSSFASSSDWESISSSDMVATATIANGVDNLQEVVFTLETPFQYSGADNLLICIADVTGSWSGGLAGATASCSGNMAIYAYRDASAYNTENPDESGYTTTNRNVVKLNITPGAAPSCTRPTGLQVSNVEARTAQLSWVPGADETSWQICLNGDEENLVSATTNPFDLTNLTPETAYAVKVRAVCAEDDYSNWSNTVNFTTLPSCPVPTELAYADVTTNSVVLSWTAGGSETAWQICINNNETELVDVTENPYTLTGLAPATTYSVKVRANCGDTDGNSQWTSAVQFTTECAAISSLPYEQGFESTGVPICWTKVGAGTAAGVSNTSYSSYSYSGSYYLKFSGTTGNNIIAMPQFDESLSSLVLDFYTRPESNTNSNCGTFEVGYISDLTDVATFVALDTYSYDDWASTSYEKKTVNMTSVPAGSYMAFNHKANSSSWYWFVDDVTVREASHAAEILTYSLPTQVADATINSENGEIAVTVAFTTDLNALAPVYTISAGAEISAPVVTVAGNGESCTVEYDVTAEDGTTIKHWTVTVTKAPVNHDAFITAFTFAGQKAGSDATIVSDTENGIYTVNAVAEWNTNITTIAPAITISDNATVNPESGDVQDFTTPVTYTVTAEDGTTQHAYTVTIVNDPDACINPATVNVTELTATTATLSWEQAYTETSYLVKVSTEAMTDMTATANVFDGTVEATTKALEDLVANTPYFVYVQSACDNAEGWTSIIFHTLCNAVTEFPWTENFESYEVGDFDDNCWVNEHISGSGASIFRVSTSTNGSNSTHQLVLPDMYSGTMTKLMLPEMTLTEGNVYAFGLDVYRNNYYTVDPDEGIRIFASTNGEIEGATELAFVPRQYSSESSTVEAESGIGWYTYKFDIPFTGTCYIILRGESRYRTATYVDNFVVRELSHAAEIVDFDFPTRMSVPVIDSENATVTATASYQADLEVLAEVVTVSEGATYVETSVSVSGNVKTYAYSVTSEDETETRNWTVTVTKAEAASSANDIVAFSFVGQVGESAIDPVEHTVTAYAEWDFDLENNTIAPTIEVSPMATINPVSGDAQNFSAPVQYAVTAEDGESVANWTVTITNDPNACVNPAEITVENVTSTGATLSWDKMYQETTYIVKVSTVAYGSEEELLAATEFVYNDIVALEGDEATLALTDLTPATYYYVYVQSNCENAESWTVTYFGTECDGSAYSVPFVETFDMSSNSVLCWTVIDANNDAEDWGGIYGGAWNIGDLIGDGNITGGYVYSPDNDANDWLISPKIAIVDGAYLTFDYAGYSYYYTEKFSVYVMDDPANYASATQILTTQIVETADYASIANIDLSAYADQEIYIGIKCESEADQDALFIDNFKVVLPVYTITATAGENGTIDPASAEVMYGYDKTFTITPAEGYRIAAVVVDAETEDEANVANDVVAGEEAFFYTFENVTANHTINVTFELIPTYTITVDAGENGTVLYNDALVSEPITVNEGATPEFVITPATGYQIEALTVGGETVELTAEQLGGYTYTFEPVMADVTLVVTFEAIPATTYTITLTVGEHGTVIPTDEDDNEIAVVNGVVTVNEDDDLYLVITPEENYQIGELIVDGTPVEVEEEDLAGFTFSILGVSSDMAVSVTFVPASSVDILESGSMAIYPNPNNGMFSIDFSNIEGDATYQLIDARGAVVETRDINVMSGETMNFNHDLRPGAYFVRIINGDKVYVEQIVVE